MKHETSALNTANARWFERRGYQGEWYEGEQPSTPAERWRRQDQACDRAVWFLLAAGLIAFVLMVVAAYYLAVAAVASLPVGFWIGVGLFLFAVGGLAYNIWLGDDG